MIAHRPLVLAALCGCLVLPACASDDAPAPQPADGVLEPPAAGQGLQYRMVSTIEPGQEVERCQLFTAPPEGLAVINEEIRFSPGSHHVLLYKTDYMAMPTKTRSGAPIDPTQPHDCAEGAAAAWDVTGVIGGSQNAKGGSFVHDFPEGVALTVAPGTVMVMNTHYINTSAKPLEADARINVYTVPREKVVTEAGVLFYYNPYIRVPANGTSTARMRCPIEKDISLVNVQSHMHRRGVNFVASLTDGRGKQLQELYTNAEWESVPVKTFDPVLEVKAGQALDYRCEYDNPESHDIVQGSSTRDEMCMLIGPYFPKDQNLENCLSGEGEVAATFIGDGQVSCAETMSCMNTVTTADDFYGCIVDSCPAASEPMSALIRCQAAAGYGACVTACSGDGTDCLSCLLTACAAPIDSCAAAACN